jgi:hypothetical protein
MALDPTTDIGKLRLRVGDYSDLPIFPDSVYSSALADTQTQFINGLSKTIINTAPNNIPVTIPYETLPANNLPAAARLMSQYILGALTSRTHQKLAQVEMWGAEWFNNYLKFVQNTILNPQLMDMAPMPYTPLTYDQYGNQILVPLLQFQYDWNNNYAYGTQDQTMRWTAYPAYPGFDGTTQNYF